jgi:ABC-2 type transport system permease protein
MRSVWLVAKREYRSMVMRRGFVILTAAIPLGMIVLVGLGILVETLSQNRSKLPLGYVDQAGLLDTSRQAALPGDEKRVEVRAFPDQETALAALEGGEIQAFFVFPPDYLQTLHTALYYLEKPPNDDTWGEFDDFVRANLVASYPAQIQQRLLEGTDVTVHDIVSNREFGESTIVNIVLPFVATFFFFFATMSAAGSMLSVVAGEKENRTMEILVTSVTPGQLIGGKAAGLLAASLTQLAIYVVAAVVGLKVAAPYVPELQQAVVPWRYLGMMALFFLPAYGLIAAIMMALGSAVTDVQQGQQIAGLLNLFFMLPILLTVVIFEDPSHPLVVLMTLFPTTSFLTISLRWGLGSVPLWQLGASWVLLVATVAFMLWAAARVFRVGMLRYGQPMSWKAVVAAVRGY